MPRGLSEYTAREWRRLRPIVERYKQGRFKLRLAILLQRRPPAWATEPILAQLAGKRVVCVVAFNDSALIELQAKLVAAFLRDVIYLIADNSSDAAAARAIAATAERQGVPYIKVPATPWRGEAGGRAHGYAMTWIWRYVLRPARPSAFGFIDHDIFPTRPTDPFAGLANSPVAGRVWNRPPRWHLWAGFCFFRFDAVGTLPLDFALDWYAGLDTGGCNWWVLYRSLDRARIPDPGCRVQAILPGVSASECAIELLGGWLHESRFAYSSEFHDRKHAEVMRLLTPLAAGQLSSAIEEVIEAPPMDR